MASSSHKRPRSSTRGGRGTQDRAYATIPSGLWLTNPLHHMTHFPVEEEFLATCPYAKMGINLLLGRRLGTLFGPFETPVPRMVRLFYQNMHREYRTNDFGIQTEHLMTHVDGYDIEVVPHILARAANIFGTEEDVASDERAPVPDIIQPADMALAVSEGRSPRGSAITRHGELATSLWFADIVLNTNIFPTTHKDERRNEQLFTLYALYRNHQLSIPAMMISQMKEVIDRPAKRRLPFANFIHRYIRAYTTAHNLPFSISNSEPLERQTAIYLHGNWTKSVNSLEKREKRPASQPAAEGDDPDHPTLHTAGPSASASATSPQDEWVFTRDHYGEIIDRLDLHSGYMRQMMEALGLNQQQPPSPPPSPPPQ